MCNWTEHLNGDKKHLSVHQEALKLHNNQSFQNGKELAECKNYTAVWKEKQ